MNLSRYQTIPTQAEITAKGKPDVNEIHRRKMDAAKQSAIPGAQADAMFQIHQGEICMGRRDRKAEKSYDGDYMELCLSTTAGLDVAGKEALVESEHYFVGVAKDVDLATDTDFFGQSSMEHGFAAVRHGSVTTMNNNNTREDIHAGDLVMVTLGRFAQNPAEMERFQVDTGRNSKQQNSGLSPISKPLWQTVPFNPNQFVTQRAALRMIMLNKLQDQETAKFEADGKKPLKTLEEEAGAMALGILRLAQNFGVAGSQVGQTFTADNIAVLRDATQNSKWFDDMVRATTGVYHHKCSLIIGTALNGAKVGGQLNIALGQGRTGF